MNTYEEEIGSLLEQQIAVTFRGQRILKKEDVVLIDCVREDECCMRDYITDDQGAVVQVNFDVFTDYCW